MSSEKCTWPCKVAYSVYTVRLLVAGTGETNCEHENLKVSRFDCETFVSNVICEYCLMTVIFGPKDLLDSLSYLFNNTRNL